MATHTSPLAWNRLVASVDPPAAVVMSATAQVSTQRRLLTPVLGDCPLASNASRMVASSHAGWVGRVEVVDPPSSPVDVVMVVLPDWATWSSVSFEVHATRATDTTATAAMATARAATTRLQERVGSLGMPRA
jgi:hypothetical protein